MLSNAVDHGGGGRAMEESQVQGGARVSLHLVVRLDGWTLSVGDQGGGDPDEVAALLSHDDTPEADDERGRGFFLVKQMVDGLHVGRSADGLGLEFTAVRIFGRR
jgi:anti-sigma regulatory factor (Ser/Thr protein kinase)